MQIVPALTLLFTGCDNNDGFISQNNNKFALTIADAEVQLVDVRTPGEFAEGHIPGAMNIDVNSDDFDTRSDELLDKERDVAIYCRSGARSKTAARRLVAKGFKVYELDKGFIRWDGRKVK